MSARSLLYVQHRQFSNLIRVTLRTPKRLIPAVLFAIYVMGMGFSQIVMHMHGGVRQPLPMGMLPVDMIQSILLFAVIWLSLATIYHALSESLVIYSQSELDVLIAMPVGRRIVMGFKLGGLYAKFALITLLFGIFFVPQMLGAYGMASPVLALAGWLSILLYAIIIINISTVINLIVACSNEDKRWQKRLIQGLGIGLLLLASAAIYTAYMRTGNPADGISALTRQPILVWLAAPAVWTSGIAVSALRGWQPAYAWQLAALALLAVATMEMVLARKENPYEPSLVISTRKARIKSAVKSGDLSAVRAERMRNRTKSAETLVAPFGRGATAILWKNMLISMRSSRTAMIGAAIIVPCAALIGRATIKDPELLNFTPQIMAGVVLYATWIMALHMQQMLRADLKQVNVLKPMPISPWWLMVAETANTGLMMWAFIWLLFGSAVFLLGAPASSLLIVAGLSLPFIAYASICSQTAVAVLYPNWHDVSQQWIANLLSMGLSMLSVGPPVAVGALLWFLHVPPWITAPVVIVISLGLAAGGITLGAVTYRRHDPTDE